MMRSSPLLGPAAAPRWPVAAATTVLWAAAAASVAYWGLRLSAPADAAPPPAVPAATVADIDSAAVSHLLGARSNAEPAAAAPGAARFSLLGVVVDDAGQGAALIAVDGKPARPYRAGAALADGYVLQSLDARAVHISSSREGNAGTQESKRLTLQLHAPALAVNGPPRAPLALPAPN